MEITEFARIMAKTKNNYLPIFEILSYNVTYTGGWKNGTKNGLKVVPYFPTLSHYFPHCPIFSNTSKIIVEIIE